MPKESKGIWFIVYRAEDRFSKQSDCFATQSVAEAEIYLDLKERNEPDTEYVAVIRRLL